MKLKKLKSERIYLLRGNQNILREKSKYFERESKIQNEAEILKFNICWRELNQNDTEIFVRDEIKMKQ